MNGTIAFACFALLAVATLIPATPAYSQDENIDPCSLTRFDPDCSPSGWVSFIIGDLTLALIIAMMIFYLQKRTTARLADAIMFVQKVLKHEEESKRRQLVLCDPVPEELL